MTDFPLKHSPEETVTVMMPTPGPPAAPDDAQKPAAPPGSSRVPWRAAGLGLASLGAPAGIGVADPLLGQVVAAIELVAAIAAIGTALFGSPVLSERAFRLLRWIANRPEPPCPPAPAAAPPAGP